MFVENQSNSGYTYCVFPKVCASVAGSYAFILAAFFDHKHSNGVHLAHGSIANF